MNIDIFIIFVCEWFLGYFVFYKCIYKGSGGDWKFMVSKDVFLYSYMFNLFFVIYVEYVVKNSIVFIYCFVIECY